MTASQKMRARPCVRATLMAKRQARISGFTKILLINSNAQTNDQPISGDMAPSC
jgi:hypothetical protein